MGLKINRDECGSCAQMRKPECPTRHQRGGDHYHIDPDLCTDVSGSFPDPMRQAPARRRASCRIRTSWR